MVLHYGMNLGYPIRIYHCLFYYMVITVVGKISIGIFMCYRSAFIYLSMTCLNFVPLDSLMSNYKPMDNSIDHQRSLILRVIEFNIKGSPGLRIVSELVSIVGKYEQN